jgi:hypothetical protein
VILLQSIVNNPGLDWVSLEECIASNPFILKTLVTVNIRELSTCSILELGMRLKSAGTAYNIRDIALSVHKIQYANVKLIDHASLGV